MKQDYSKFRYKVKAEYLKYGDSCFRFGVEMNPYNEMHCITDKNPYISKYPWFEFKNHPQNNGWCFDYMITDHPVYSEGWEYPGDGTRKTKFYLMSEEIEE
jgi:hypothetical protein